MKTNTNASTLQIPLIQKITISPTTSTAHSASSCCTPKNNASVCCTPNEDVAEKDGLCCAQPEDGSPCCNK